jgi:4-hydroxythreonine-4-phosphate dehydrogenase
MPLPLLAVTLGDPCGIGPEVALKTLAHADLFQTCRPLLIGDERILRRAAGWLGLDLPNFERITDRRKAPTAGKVPADLGNADCPPARWAGLSGGRAGSGGICVCRLRPRPGGPGGCHVTAPLECEAMNLAGFITPHTDAGGAHRGPKVTMLTGAARGARIYPRFARGSHPPGDLSPGGEVIDLAQAACLALGTCPRIAVAGLNPHASEEGLFGSQRRTRHTRRKTPRARVVSGRRRRIPSSRARRMESTTSVAMYHDQAIFHEAARL